VKPRAGAVPLSAPLTAGLLALFFWLLVGDLGLAIRDRSALPTGLELLRRGGTSDTATSLLLSTVPALLSVLLAPLVGYHSDRYRGRHGRRRPFIAVAAPVGAAAMIGLSLSPWLGPALHLGLGGLSPGLATCKLIVFGLFWTVFECAAITAAALFAGLVNDVVPRALLGRFYGALRVVSLSLGIAFNSWVFELTDHYLYEILFGIGLTFGLPLLLMCAMVREDPQLDATPRRGSWLVPREHVLACFRERRFWWICAAFMLASSTFNPFNTFYLHFAQASGISKDTLGAMTAYGYISSIVTALGIGYLVDRFGALRVAAVIMGLYFVNTAAGYAFVQGAASFAVFYVGHVVISGAYFTAAASLPMALFPKAQFVQYNSTKDLMTASSTIVVSALQGPLLDLSGHAYSLTLLSAAVFSFLCVICLVRLRNSHH
jgi:Na+/melibiose symporter-like transporter